MAGSTRFEPVLPPLHSQSHDHKRAPAIVAYSGARGENRTPNLPLTRRVPYHSATQATCYISLFGYGGGI